MLGVGQTISKLGTFFEKYLSHSIPIFEKRSHPMRPVEGLKLCFNFLCNMSPTYVEIVWPTPNTPRALTVKGVYVAEKLMGKTWGLG